MRSEADFLVEVVQRLNRTGLGYMLTGSMASNQSPQSGWHGP
jgi:hypothetical protein